MSTTRSPPDTAENGEEQRTITVRDIVVWGVVGGGVSAVALTIIVGTAGTYAPTAVKAALVCAIVLVSVSPAIRGQITSNGGDV